jgi:SAM-dependent methyltransferase
MYVFTQPDARTFAQPILPVVNMRRSYDRYYATGLYDSRYPAPNPHVLQLILSELGSAGGRILDFGCGTGRYALALAQQPGVSVFAYDISAAAIQDLSRRWNKMAAAAAMPARLETLSGNFEDLEQRLEGDAGFDLVVLLFGVLGHIPRRERRVAMLRSCARGCGRAAV